jgi:CubicO group peptidase (beta-lactamase class C family)
MVADFPLTRALACRAVDERVVPGLVLGLRQAGRTRYLDAFGNRQISPQIQPLGVDTVFDLASLTKAVVTSLLIMRGVGLGIWKLDDPLAAHLPAMRDNPEPTIRMALSHAAGFPAHRPFYEQVLKDRSRPTDGRERILALAASEPLAYAPGTQSVYSDLGFMLLGDLVERGLGDRLDRLAERLLFVPLGVRGLGFAGSDALIGRTLAPTEECALRGGMLLGQVHDLNAYAMGGVAGHAGLFGNATDLLVLADALCAAWREAGPGGGAPIVPGEVLRLFWQPAGVPGSTWRLGWDGPSLKGSLAGDRLSRQAVGHLGFTGYSLWIDPQRETTIVLLTNFVHPRVHKDPRFRTLRPAIHDALLEDADYRA